MAGFVENLNQVAQRLTPTTVANINLVVTQVVPNMAEILLADDNAVIATQKAALTAADVLTTHADVVLTHTDVNTTHADVVLTHADVVLTHADVVLTHADVVTTIAQANAAILASNNAQVASLITSAYGNIDWAGFVYNDGELLVNYFSSSASTPSLVDGEFIITY